MGYRPSFRIYAYAADDDAKATPLSVPIISGKFRESAFEASASLEFDIPVDWDEAFDNYAAFASTILQTGAFITLETSETGAGGWLMRLDGNIWEVERRRTGGLQTRHFVCRDKNARVRSINANLHAAAEMRIYETTFAAADFNVDDPDFTVDIPDNSEDWVPGGCIYLAATFNDGTELHVHDYDTDEYVFAAARKQIMFQQQGGGEGTSPPPAANKKDEGWTWTVRLYYYNQTDTGNSVNSVLTDLATGTPWSAAGGLGWAAADVNLADIVSFDGVSLKLIRTVILEKDDGPINQAIDTMRDSGLIPSDYRIYHDPVTDKLVGVYLEQNNGAAVTPAHGVIEDFEPYSLESVAGRVENWSGNGTPVNYALTATVTVNSAWLAAEGYTKVGDEDNINDSKNATFVQFQKDMTSGPDYAVTPTAVDMLVLELEKLSTIKKIMLRHTSPKEALGSEWIDIPVYFVSRQPRITISGSEYRIAALFATTVAGVTSDTVFDVADASGFQTGDFIMVGVAGGDVGVVITNIVGTTLTVDPAATGVAPADAVTLDNPGIPFGKGTLNISLDPTNVDDNGRDIDAEAEFIQQCNFVAIRWEQDFFYRRDGNNVGATARQSWYGLREIRLLGDEIWRYDSGDDDGSVAYAQITDKGSTVSAVVVDPTQFTLNAISGIEGIWAAVGQDIQLEHLGTIYTGEITVRVGNTITVVWDSAPPNVSINDKVGWRRRWMEDFAGVWQDLYCPKLFRKIYNTSHWVDILKDEQASDVYQAEQLCLGRLLQLIKISRDKHCNIALDHNIGIGTTVELYTGEDPWMVTEQILHLNPIADGEEIPPAIIQEIRGSDYEGTPE